MRHDWLQTLVWIHHPNGLPAFLPKERAMKNKKPNKAATIEGLVFLGLGLQRIWAGGEGGLRAIGKVVNQSISEAWPAITGLLRHRPAPPMNPEPPENPASPFVSKRRPKARRKSTTTRKKA